MNADKFTQKTIETIQTAQSMAQENGNQYLTPEHLLYALVDADGGLIGTLLGLGLMLSAGEIPRIAGAFGLDTSTRANLSSAVYTAQTAINITKTVAKAAAA